jgi:hypothetical protein
MASLDLALVRCSDTLGGTIIAYRNVARRRSSNSLPVSWPRAYLSEASMKLASGNSPPARRSTSARNF